MMKGITYKVSARIAAGAVGVAMIASGFSMAMPAAAAGLTASQIQSILSLLQSFGADSATISNVNAALNGQATTGTTTGGTTTTTGGSCSATFTSSLKLGSSSSQVLALQKFLNMDPDTHDTLCIACNLCAIACPEDCIDVIPMDVEIVVAGKPRRKKVLDEFIFDTSRCMFCALCQEACPTSCLELTQDFELATYSRAGFVWNREMLEQGRETVKYTS